MESKAEEEGSRSTKCESGGRVLGSWCRSMARIMPGSKSEAESCTLLVFIDDATGQLVELWFVPDETFFTYCEASQAYFERYGKPLAFYSDKHGIFRVNQPSAVGTTSG